MEVISYIALIVVVIALVVLGVVGALELSQYYFKWEVKITDTDKYLKTNGFLSEFSIFPESLDGITGVNEYHYYDGGIGTGKEVFLEIVYSPEEFEEEIKRIESTVGEKSGKGVKYDDAKLFGFKTYISIYHYGAGGEQYEYACVDEENKKIVYVYLEWRSIEYIGFDHRYLPLEYASSYGNKDGLSFDMYGTYEKDVWYDQIGAVERMKFIVLKPSQLSI